MANPTSNFGWQMPQPTDLVTDLPADFEVFGQAVDTDLADLKGGTTGQILSKTSNTDLDFTWINNDQGDITEVVAGTGLTGGGSSGSVTLTNAMADAITTKGDLLVGTAADSFARLGAGTNGYYLEADSGEATGLKWSPISAGGVTLIQQTATGGVSLSFSNISQNYKHLLLTWNGVNSNIAFTIRLNNNSNTLYDYNNQAPTTSVADKAFCERPDQGSDLYTAKGSLWIYDYASTSYWKSYKGAVTNYSNQVGWYYLPYDGQFRSTSAITSVDIIGNNTNTFYFASGGNVALWGIG